MDSDPSEEQPIRCSTSPVWKCRRRPTRVCDVLRELTSVSRVTAALMWRDTMDLLLITGRLVRLMLIKINLVRRLARPTDRCMSLYVGPRTPQGRGRFRVRGPLSQGPADGWQRPTSKRWTQKEAFGFIAASISWCRYLSRGVMRVSREAWRQMSATNEPSSVRPSVPSDD